MTFSKYPDNSLSWEDVQDFMCNNSMNERIIEIFIAIGLFVSWNAQHWLVPNQVLMPQELLGHDILYDGHDILAHKDLVVS